MRSGVQEARAPRRAAREILKAVGFALGMSGVAFPIPVFPASLHSVLILQHRFDPDSLVVLPGDTVRWLHQDATAHTVTGTGPEVWDSDRMNFGDAFTRVFVASGSFDYVCLYHPMSGKVMVTDPAAVRPSPGSPIQTNEFPTRDALGRSRKETDKNVDIPTPEFAR